MNFDIGLFAPIYRSRSGLPRQKIALPRQNRAWIISHFTVPSNPKWEIIHPRMSGNPHSTRMTGTGPAFVSICNSKRVIPPPSVTDRDITQRHQLTSHSVTVRTVSASSCYRSRYYRPTLGIVSICNYKEGFQPTRVTDRDKPEAWWESNPLTCRHK